MVFEWGEFELTTLTKALRGTLHRENERVKKTNKVEDKRQREKKKVKIKKKKDKIEKEKKTRRKKSRNRQGKTKEEREREREREREMKKTSHIFPVRFQCFPQMFQTYFYHKKKVKKQKTKNKKRKKQTNNKKKTATAKHSCVEEIQTLISNTMTVKHDKV